MREMIRSKKQLLVIMSIVGVGILCTGFLFWRHYSHSSTSKYVAQKCANYGGTFDSFGPGSIQNIISDSQAIVVATVDNPRALGDSVRLDDVVPLVHVTRVLKSAGNIHTNDVLALCAGMGDIELPADPHPIILVFIEGRDGHKWVPSWGYFGISPRDKDGDFKLEWASSGPTSVTITELQRIIK
ncbi:MAG TPA: hypothetical protein VJP80_08155 [Candidatus Saccharimonadales bacterium]|nr:hypothetical protein [Candidatus Saccharimonadales bacterium]